MHFVPEGKCVTPAPSFRRTLLFYYIHVFFYNFIFGYAVFPAYFQLKGTSPDIIGYLLAFWAACIIAFEIPSGLIADLSDRRLLLVTAPLIKAMCFVIWIFAGGHTYLYFIGIAFWSLASALRSGTKEALLYEHTSSQSELSQYTKILGRERALQEAATLSGAAIGGLIASQNLELSFWLSILPLSLSALGATFVRDIRQTAAKSVPAPATPAPFQKKTTWVGLIRSTWDEYFIKPEVRHITLYVVLCVTFLGTLEDFNQLFLLAVKLPVWSIGLVVGAMGLARMALALSSGRLEPFPVIKWIIPFLCGVALLASGFLSSAYALLAMASAYVLVAPLLVLTTSQFQKALEGSSRATTTSVMSVFIESLSVIFNIGIALLLSILTVLKTYQVCGGYLMAFALWEWWQSRHRTRVYDSPETTKKVHIKTIE